MSVSITMGQLQLVDVIRAFELEHRRLPYLYELCEITGRQPHHLHCIINNLVELELLDYPEDLMITPNMKNVLALAKEGNTVEEIGNILGLHQITLFNVLSILRDKDLLPEEFEFDGTNRKTYVEVCNDVYIEVALGKDKNQKELINLCGCRGYIKTIDDHLTCVIYHECTPYSIDLEAGDVEEIPCYKESGHGFSCASKTDSVKIIRTYIRFHRH